MPCARTGGHAAAQAAAQELLPRASLRNRYTVRPRESTSTLPSPPAGSSPMVAGRPLAVFAGPGVSLAPPQAAMARAASGAPAAVATMRLDAQEELIGPMLTTPRLRSRQHSDRPTREPDRHPGHAQRPRSAPPPRSPGATFRAVRRRPRAPPAPATGSSPRTAPLPRGNRPLGTVSDG